MTYISIPDLYRITIFDGCLNFCPKVSDVTTHQPIMFISFLIIYDGMISKNKRTQERSPACAYFSIYFSPSQAWEGEIKRGWVSNYVSDYLTVVQKIRQYI